MTVVRPRRSPRLAMLACLLGLGASACDTVALISFSEREFQGIETSGFTATAGSCSTGIEDGRATLRFVLMADDGSPIRPGESVAKTTVNITADSVEFRDGETAIYEVPIVEDDPTVGPTDRAEKPCSTGECRQSGMECTTGPVQPDSAEARRCQRTASVSLEGPIEFDSDTTSNQLFGVLYENSGSLEGWLPSDVGALYADWDGDGTAEGGDDAGVITSRASDPTRQAKAALSVLISNWRQAAQNARDDGQRLTSFGLWEFNGTSTAGVTSLVSKIHPNQAIWTTEVARADDARDEFSQITGTRANVYMAIDHVLETAYAPAEYGGYEKTLVVFVDGPDDLRFPQYTAESVAARAADLGVRLFIVHLDASQVPTTQAGTPVHRDDPRYWNERVDGEPVQEPCASDADCKNFERCRVPTAYSSTPQAPVEINPAGQTYCVPERDKDNGRFGPIHDYARIACETDGGYIYIKEGSGIRPRIDWLPYAMDGLWKVDTVVDVLENRNVEPDDTYLLQTTLSVTIGGTQRSYDFSQTGEAISSDDGADTRAALFN